MQSIVAYVIAHQAELAAGAGALYTLLSVINGLIHSPKANTFLGDVLDVISYISRKGAAGSVKAPFTRSTAPSDPVIDGASARALLPLLLVPLVAFSACAPSPCLQPQNAATAKCKLESNLISCGEQDAFALLPVVVSVIGPAIDGNGFNAANVEQQLELQGIADVPCVLAALEQYIAPSNPQLAEKFHAVAAVALKKKGARGIVDVKLKSGRAVPFVIE